MSKRFLGWFLILLSIIAASVLWFLDVMMDDFSFSWSWAVVIISSTSALVFIVRGLFTKNVGVLKKMSILIGAGMAIVTVFALTFAISMPDKIMPPIIALIISVAMLLCFLAVGGKKWDQGDNQNVGYKNYYQRKAEQEKQKQKEKDE